MILLNFSVMDTTWVYINAKLSTVPISKMPKYKNCDRL